MVIGNVLSLCDGISGGQMALERSGIKYKKYYSSEIDKFAIIATQHNYPDTVQLGDITKIDTSILPEIDLLISGTPCQSFSSSGKQKGMVTKENVVLDSLEKYLELKSKGFEFEGQSYLFWEFVRILNDTRPKYFFMENVVMKKYWEDIISNTLGVEPIVIDSALITAQNRKRLYWTNIPDITLPEELGIVWDDIRDKSIVWPELEDKESLVSFGSSHGKKLDHTKEIYGIESPASIVGRRLNSSGHREDYNKDVPITQCLEVRGGVKMACLTTVKKDTVVSILPHGRYPGVYSKLKEGTHYRDLTIKECCRLQTVPENYFFDNDGKNIISNSQIMKALGNGWTIDIISHIFSNIV